MAEIIRLIVAQIILNGMKYLHDYWARMVVEVTSNKLLQGNEIHAVGAYLNIHVACLQ